MHSTQLSGPFVFVLFTVAWAAGVTRLCAQTVRGVVLEDVTNAAVSGAALDLVGPNGRTVRAVSDSAGTFVLRAQGSGRYVVYASHPGYARVQSDSISLATGEMIAVRLRMSMQAIPLSPLVVTHRGNARRGGFYDRMENPGGGYFLTRLDLDRQPGSARITDALQMIPGVRVTPIVRARGAANGTQVTLRSGGGRCSPAIFIDGMPVRQLIDSGIDDLLQPGRVEGVEIYSGSGTPAQFTRPDACGALIFWTRTGTDEQGTRFSWKRAGLGTILGLAMILMFKSF